MAAVLACRQRAVLEPLHGRLDVVVAVATRGPRSTSRSPGGIPGDSPRDSGPRARPARPPRHPSRQRIPLSRPGAHPLDLAGGSLARPRARAERGAHPPSRPAPAAPRCPRALSRPPWRGRAARAARSRAALTRSEAEARLLTLLRAAGLPPTAVNARIGRYEVDFLWRPKRLVVEVDGYAYHSTRAAFERDRARDAELQAAGHRVIRVTWRQLIATPEAVVARIAAALAATARQ